MADQVATKWCLLALRPWKVPKAPCFHAVCTQCVGLIFLGDPSSHFTNFWNRLRKQWIDPNAHVINPVDKRAFCAILSMNHALNYGCVRLCLHLRSQFSRLHSKTLASSGHMAWNVHFPGFNNNLFGCWDWMLSIKNMISDTSFQILESQIVAPE